MRKTPITWPRSWASLSLFQLYSRRKAWANYLAPKFWANLTPFSLKTADVYVCLSHTGVNRGDTELAGEPLFDLVFNGLGRIVASYHRSSTSYQIR